MKNLFLLTMAIIMVTFFGCSSEQKNDFKAKVAIAVADKSGEILSKEFSKDAYSGMNCESEVVKIKSNIEREVKSALKYEEGMKSIEKSIAGSIAKLACKSVFDQALPLIFDNRIQDYPCVAKGLSLGSINLGSQVCDRINL